ncbi:MAG: hypothetical protein LBQ50_08465 [Planctomycetaceae bacterium]|jgi:hypothetical protein|nr:hypothetical protein [Planctomycetaceae bacterium]
MTQLQSFSGMTFDVPVTAEIPCPVPDWEYGALRAYSQEEQKAIRNWYVERGLVKPLEELIGQPRPMTKSDLEEIKNIGKELFSTDEELKDFVETLEENRRIDRELEEKRTARLLEMMGEDNSP